MTHVLVTGFGPFENVCINASGVVAQRVASERESHRVDPATVGESETGHLAWLRDGRARPSEWRVKGLELPTAYGRARELASQAAREFGCRAVVALGVWRGHDVRVERRASGIVTSERRDARGEIWNGFSLGGDQVSRVDVAALADAIGARVSEDCGGYVCNATYQALLSATDKPTVFLHIPRDVGASGLAATEAVVRKAIAFMAQLT